MLVRSVSLLLRLRNGIRHVLNNQVAPHPFLACLHSLSSYSLLPPFYASSASFLLILPSMLIPGTYVPWPSEDIMRRGRLAQLAVEGLIDPPPPPPESNATQETQETEPEEQRPRRNPGRRATSVEARRRKMSAGGEPKPITAAQQQQQLQKKEEMDFELDLFNPDEDS